MQHLYRSFAETHILPLYLQPDWLDAVCPNGWSAAITTDAGGDVTGLLPYARTRRYGLPTIVPPRLTQYNAPWLQYPDQQGFKTASRYAFQKKVIAELVAQLPKTAFSKFVLPPQQRDNLAWHWQGYKEKVLYTYQMLPQDINQIRRDYKNTVRTNLIKAQQRVAILQSDNPQVLSDLVAKVFRRKNASNPYPQALILEVFGRLRQIEQCTLLVAHDLDSQQPHAALLLAWDDQYVHGVLTGQDERFKDSCAPFLLYDHAIEFAQKQGKTLDLEGSMQPNIEHFFRSFGAVQTPYSVMRKYGW
jgi:Acetyltransferase (GNAT) domain